MTQAGTEAINLYEQDYVAWADEQAKAALLEARRFL